MADSGLFSTHIGSIRCHRDPVLEVGPRPRCLPPSVFQEHSRDRPGHQRLEASARCYLPRERQGAQGGRPHATICRQHWPHRPRYDSANSSLVSDGLVRNSEIANGWDICVRRTTMLMDLINRQAVRCLQGSMARQVRRVPPRSPQEC
jgi:hypothetical protein